MAIVVEDGTIVSGANSYADLAFADAYFDERNDLAGWVDLVDEDKDAGLLYASSWIDRGYRWRGSLVDHDIQPMAWPRYSVVDDEEREYTFPDASSHQDASIPLQLKHAVCELAKLHLTTALNESLERGGGTKRVKIGPIEEEYFETASFETEYPYIERLLVGLHNGATFGGMQVEMVRG